MPDATHSGRLRLTYRIAALPDAPVLDGAGRPTDAARDRAEAVARESTLEVPVGVAPARIEADLLGRVESLEPADDGSVLAVLTHTPDILDGGLPQLLNVMHGNISMLPGVRLVDAELPADVLAAFPGPRFGIPGLRSRVGQPTRPLVASALKPVGLGAAALARQAAAMTRAGLDVVKDDHSLANQRSAPFLDRVRAVADAVARENARTGGRTLYMPNITGPAEVMQERAEAARAAGCGGLLVSPGLVGLDAMRALAAGPVDLPIMSHPSRADVGTARDTGMAPDLHFGLLHRLAGADMVVYVNAGGRFDWSVETCRVLNDRLRSPLGDLAPAFPVPAGGVDRERAPRWFEIYGPDVLLLIGGSLLRQPDLEAAARALVDAAWEART
jgi:ribulose-bisphosphate carboxylase large chain